MASKFGRRHKEDFSDSEYDDDDTASSVFTVASTASIRTDPFQIHLPRRHRYRNLQTASSFPSLLDVYPPIAEEDYGRSRLDSSDDEDDSDRYRWLEHRRRNERHAQRIEAVAKEQMKRYEQYIKELHEKVERQRQERQQQFLAAQARLQQQEEERKRRRGQRKLPKQVYIHDTSYLKNIPESRICRMVKLTEKMKKSGVLKDQRDVEQFWEDNGAMLERKKERVTFLPQVLKPESKKERPTRRRRKSKLLHTRVLPPINQLPEVGQS